MVKSGISTLWRLRLEDSLGDFKRSNGFQKFDLPRYYVPLTGKGKLALKLGLHRGWKEAVPKPLRKPLKKLRRRWYDLQCRLTNKCEAQAEGLSTPTD